LTTHKRVKLAVKRQRFTWFVVHVLRLFSCVYGNFMIYTVFQKKTSTHIIGYKLRNSCPILIIFDIKIPHII